MAKMSKEEKAKLLAARQEGYARLLKLERLRSHSSSTKYQEEMDSIGDEIRDINNHLYDGSL